MKSIIPKPLPFSREVLLPTHGPETSLSVQDGEQRQAGWNWQNCVEISGKFSYHKTFNSIGKVCSKACKNLQIIIILHFVRPKSLAWSWQQWGIGVTHVKFIVSKPQTKDAFYCVLIRRVILSDLQR